MCRTVHAATSYSAIVALNAYDNEGMEKKKYRSGCDFDGLLLGSMIF